MSTKESTNHAAIGFSHRATDQMRESNCPGNVSFPAPVHFNKILSHSCEIILKIGDLQGTGRLLVDKLKLLDMYGVTKGKGLFFPL